MARHNGAAEVAEFLRARRTRLKPADVGLPAGGRRRTPGLRREEVAQLADISPTYYTFLEQGRDVRPSEHVLDALGRALRLTPAERAHLHDMVHGGPVVGAKTPDDAAAVGRRSGRAPGPVAGVRHRALLRRAHLQPCGPRAVGRLAGRPEPERNVLWWTFLDPAARAVLADWESVARAELARLRSASARRPDDPRFGTLIAELQAGSAEARRWWPEHDVVPLSSGMKRIWHPALGVIEFQHVVLQVADDPEQKLVTFTASPPDAARIAALIGD